MVIKVQRKQDRTIAKSCVFEVELIFQSWNLCDPAAARGHAREVRVRVMVAT